MKLYAANDTTSAFYIKYNFMCVCLENQIEVVQICMYVNRFLVCVKILFLCWHTNIKITCRMQMEDTACRKISESCLLGIPEKKETSMCQSELGPYLSDL